MAVCLFASYAIAQTAKPQPPLLPQSFAGWTMQGKAQTSNNPSAVDAAQSAALKEYGFTDSSQASYTKEDNKLTIKVARFQDASGAYGAFTFYRQPQMKTESVGDMAASANEKVLFLRSNNLVEAQFEHLTAMSAAELRELAFGLPMVQGSAAILPNLPNYVPRKSLVPNTAKYIIGPAAYASSGLTIPSSVVDFNRGAEVLTAKMQTSSGESDLALVSYPTPQIAIERLKAFEAANPKEQNATYAVKRTGPIVAVISGAVSESDARNILGQVNYEAQVTWNESTGLEKKNNIGSIVIAGLMLAGIIFVFSVGTGAVFGFGRVFLRKILPARFAPKERQDEIIELGLRD